MSASPAQPSSGPNSVTPTTTGPPAPRIRKKAPVSIFTKKPQPKKFLKPPQAPGPNPTAPVQAPVQVPQNAATESDDPAEYDEFPIVISKRGVQIPGQRHHAFKLQSKFDEKGNMILVNPFNDAHFTRPLRLHRRYAGDKLETADQSDAASGVDDKERELMNARRAERQAEREENQKLIAPTGGDPSKPNRRKHMKKVEEGRDDDNPVRKKRQQLRYEEARPWHLEDFDAKNVWIGSYEEPLSERSVMLEIVSGADGGKFKMVPIEKWYKFIQTNKVNSMTPEEIEKHLQRKVAMGRWAMGTQKMNDETRREEAMRVRRQRIEEMQARQRGGADDFEADRDMMDMDFKDEFQDDDEGILFQGEDGEDAQDIEQRIWLEMRGAALGGTGVKDEDVDPEEEERQKQMAEREEKRKSKKLRKQLMKREHQGQYNSDSDDPYASSSDSLDSDEERSKEEEEKKEEAKKALANGGKSGASSRGNNTPSGRPEKRSNADVSEASENESSRKRAKVSANGRAASSNVPGAGRSLSPDAAKQKLPRSTGGSGSGSDTDTSRAGRPKIRIKNSPPGSPSTNTPNGSRAASPSATGSRAQSPKPNGAVKKDFPTLEEVRAAIPPEGIEIKALVALFKAQVQSRSAEFIVLVKAAGVQDKATGRIMPRS